MNKVQEHQEKFQKAMEIAKKLEERDFNNTELKYEVYEKSATRYELITEMVKEGII